MATQGSQTPHGLIVGPPLPSGPMQFKRLGDDPRCRGLADAAHPGQQPGLRQPVARDGVAERAHHGFLAEQRIETGRAIFAGKDAIGRRRGRIGGEVEARKGDIVGIGHVGG